MLKENFHHMSWIMSSETSYQMLGEKQSIVRPSRTLDRFVMYDHTSLSCPKREARTFSLSIPLRRLMMVVSAPT